MFVSIVYILKKYHAVVSLSIKNTETVIKSNYRRVNKLQNSDDISLLTRSGPELHDITTHCAQIIVETSRRFSQMIKAEKPKPTMIDKPDTNVYHNPGIRYLASRTIRGIMNADGSNEKCLIK